jgi:hypothetical protein
LGRGLRGARGRGGIDAMPLRVLAALLCLGGIAYAMFSGNWGIGAIAFGLGAAELGLDRLRVARGRPERAIGWVLVLTGAFVVVDALVWMSIGGA